uniref:Putative salivary lipocalin n=1 Tax=Ixodes ricinus TaxID=34613 RepID=A0A0K8R5F8_IXORI
MLLNQFLFYFFNLIFQVIHYAFQLGFLSHKSRSSPGCGTPENEHCGSLYTTYMSILLRYFPDRGKSSRTFWLNQNLVYSVEVSLRHPLSGKGVLLDSRWSYHTQRTCSFRGGNLGVARWESSCFQVCRITFQACSRLT